MQETAFAGSGNAQDLAHTIEERLPVGSRMESHHVIGTHRKQQLRRARQCVKQGGGHKRRMQEESDAIAHPQAAQLLAQREQMIVVHPDHVIRAQQRPQRLGEAPVDRAIALVVLAPEVDQAEPEVQQRPQRAIGEVDVERSIFRLGQIDCRVADAVRPLQPRLSIAARASPAPTEPQRAGPQRVRQCDRQATSPWPPLRGERNPIGDNDKTRHTTSSRPRTHAFGTQAARYAAQSRVPGRGKGSTHNDTAAAKPVASLRRDIG